MNSRFNLYVRSGMRSRLDGWLDQALSAFELARNFAYDQSQRSLVWAQIGFTYLRMLEREKAAYAFQLSHMNAAWSQDHYRILEAECNRALMLLEKEQYANANRLALSVLDEAERIGRPDLVSFVHVVARTQTALYKVGKLDRSEALYWIEREVKEFISVESSSDELLLRTWREGIIRSHQDLYGIRAALEVVRSFRRVRNEMRQRTTH
ncbi:hypothetical protein A2W32_04200 [candidate division WWE3 bacterium RBG_16_37_10]|uniref:MalT-like TPR region domain-containing protein n=1 Tax=candidate division WWE3 bacterium RBG_16_37_10 TaxID=1802610 RepID=A0A1F4UWQ5_UNCKA|nr:MAG: hypothetical protein A2W32_04200 [candidate division WWE3 bacterium RBG_16_37_10]